MRAHPRFRFYGVRPRDWREVGVDGLRYELAFVREPDDVERETLAVAFEQAAAGSPVSAITPWRWHGRWARLAIAPRLPPDGAIWELARHVLWDRFFTAISDVMNALCDVVPLAQVVFADATAPSKGASAHWEEWSRARCAPDAAPAWASAVADPAFERARAMARAALEVTPWWEAMLEGLQTLP